MRCAPQLQGREEPERSTHLGCSFTVPKPGNAQRARAAAVGGGEAAARDRISHIQPNGRAVLGFEHVREEFDPQSARRVDSPAPQAAGER